MVIRLQDAVCKRCGKTFAAEHDTRSGYTPKVCSVKCRSGWHYSEESKAKLKGRLPWNTGMKGLVLSDKNWFKKGQVSWNKGKHLPEELRRKLSAIRKEKYARGELKPITYWLGKRNPNVSKRLRELWKDENFRANQIKKREGKHYSLVTEFKKGSMHGSLHPQWKGGSEAYYRHNFSQPIIRVLEKRCSYCDVTEDLCVHHMNGNYKDNRWENLMIICRSCHTRLHQPQLLKARGII